MSAFPVSPLTPCITPSPPVSPPHPLYHVVTMYLSCVCSSQLMLATCSLKDLLTLDSPTLLRHLPWIPEKCIQMFHALSHLSTSPLTHTLPTRLTPTVAPWKAPHMLAASTTHSQSGPPVSGILPNTQQRKQICSTQPIKAAIVPTQGVNSRLGGGQAHVSSIPCDDRLDVGRNYTTSNVLQNALHDGGGDQLQCTAEQVEQLPNPFMKQRQKKSFYRFSATAATAGALQEGINKPSTQLMLPHSAGRGSPPHQQQVLRSKFFPDGPSRREPAAGTQRGLKKLLAYGRQREEQESTVPLTRNLAEQAQVLRVTGSMGTHHGSGSMDQALPTAVVTPSPSIEGVWPSSSSVAKSRREGELDASIAGIRGHHRELHAGGNPAVEGGAYQEVGVAKSLPGTTPSGRKRQPVKCFSLDSEEEGMNSGPALSGRRCHEQFNPA